MARLQNTQQPQQHPLGQVRAQHGWSLTDLVNLLNERLGAGPPTKKIWAWENRAVVPGEDVQRALAAELGVPVERLHTEPWPTWLLLATSSNMAQLPGHEACTDVPGQGELPTMSDWPSSSPGIEGTNRGSCPAGGPPNGSSAASSAELRTDRPHPARLYDLYLGGKDNFPADRAAARELLEVAPTLPVTAQQNRLFLARAVRYLARAGVRQFLDIGTGIPTANNTHEVAQAEAPEARVVYVDNDPIVLAHARALLRSEPSGRTAYIQADLRDPAAILADPMVRQVLDFDQPVALMLIAVLHFVQDDADPYGIVASLVDALPSGSFLALSHVTPDYAPAQWKQIVELYREGGMSAQARTRVEIDGFLQGLELVPPGLQVVSRWRPDPSSLTAATNADISCYGAIARKP
ncbi:hypothetical protein ABH940_003224 [Streptacidiphilus sp. BW17]|uniref:SAM-dependent methyltransferase n=1 Tax=unclassified Streptacidiphilus TaxID=2643834 RepID=UPI003517DE0A